MKKFASPCVNHAHTGIWLALDFPSSMLIVGAVISQWHKQVLCWSILFSQDQAWDFFLLRVKSQLEFVHRVKASHIDVQSTHADYTCMTLTNLFQWRWRNLMLLLHWPWENNWLVIMTLIMYLISHPKHLAIFFLNTMPQPNYPTNYIHWALHIIIFSPHHHQWLWRKWKMEDLEMLLMLDFNKETDTSLRSIN